MIFPQTTMAMDTEGTTIITTLDKMDLTNTKRISRDNSSYLDLMAIA